MVYSGFQPIHYSMGGELCKVREKSDRGATLYIVFIDAGPGKCYNHDELNSRLMFAGERTWTERHGRFAFVPPKETHSQAFRME